jgi:hypothetical protein
MPEFITSSSFSKVESMKTLISLSTVSLLALGVAGCASAPTASQPVALSIDHCKQHLGQYVPAQNKDDATIRKDAACAKLVKG